MLYAYARICGIIRKASGQEESTSIEWPETSEILITDDAELELIRNLVRLPDILSEIERDLYPNKVCEYLFETSQKFNKVCGGRCQAIGDLFVGLLTSLSSLPCSSTKVVP
jgi:arginyl-tRNA synthetase